MAWPMPLEYQEAVQNPAFSFMDPVLRASEPELNSLGLPNVASGNFACVFKLQSRSEISAVRCFLREVTDQQRRYELLSQHLGSLSLPTLEGFEYLVEGIRLRGQWFPIVKMEWIEGQTLDNFVEQHLNDSQLLERLAAQFRGLVAGLQGARMAHGDLQHSNILVDGATQLRLVDYDAMFFSSLSGERSPELGHPNYQHLQRSADDYNEKIDNFAALVIYLSLLAVAAEPALWREFNTGDNLILTKQDYMYPKMSRCLVRLKKNQDPAVGELATCVEQFCSNSIDTLPDLETVLQNLKVAPAFGCKPVARYGAPTAARKTLVHVARQSKQTVRCSACGHENVMDIIYCENCARQLQQAMSQCGVCRSSIPARAAFCRVCGAKQ